MANGIITPCNMARSWHGFHQVTAPCNVACGTGIMTVNSPSGTTLQCDTWLWDDMPLKSPVAAPCNVTRSSGIMTLNSPCSRWQQPATWQVALGWHAMKFAQTSAIIGILHLVSILIISPQSTCYSAPVCKILSKSDHPKQKKMTSCRFSRWRISAILDFRGPSNNEFFENPTYNFLYVVNRHHSCRLLSFWENHVFFAFWHQDLR